MTAQPSFCDTNPYHIPQLYVEGLSSDEYLVEENGVLRRSKECPENAKCYGKAIYGVIVDEIIDLLAKKAKKSFVVVLPPDYNRGLLVEKGSYLEPLPVEGVRTFVSTCEGEKIAVDTIVGVTATGKREIRKIRSHVEGIVVYVYSSPETRPEKNIVFIAPEESVKYVQIR